MHLSKLLVAIFLVFAPLASCKAMSCGTGVPLCGTLTLQSGLGNGVYQSEAPLVHGLWPEVGKYGTSKCSKPKNPAGPVKVYDCYNTPGSSHTHALSFEGHEWQRHGMCAGAADVNDFFAQVCSLSKGPVETMTVVRKAGHNLDAMVKALKAKGYPVWAVDQMNKQAELSVCAGSDGRWVFSSVADMPTKCGGASPSPSPGPPSPAPPSPAPPQPANGSCKPGVRGPKCKQDDDCKSCDGCIRCAHSGYCTSQPLFQSAPGVLV